MDTNKSGKGESSPMINQVGNTDLGIGEVIEEQQPSQFKNTVDREGLAAALQAYVPGTKREKRLVMKIDLVIIPMLWFMCVLAYVDRNNIGNADAAGMGDDLKLTDNDYSMLISIFFVGYIIWEIPSNIILSRVRPSLYLPGIMVAWGVMVAVMSQVHDYKGILLCRFFLGMIESGFFPGVLYFMTCWYKKNEIGKRFCIFYTALCFSGAASGLIAGAVMSGLDGSHGIAGWRWLFLVEGLVTIGFAFMAFFVLPDYPQTPSKRLTEEERLLAAVRVMHDQADSVTRTKRLTPWQCVKATAVDLRTYYFIVLYMTQNGSGTVSYFIPTVLKNMGYTGTTAQWMTVPIWAVGTVFLLVFSQTADRLGDRRWHITCGLALAFISAIVNLAVKENMKVRYVFMCFYIAGLYMTLPLILNWASEIMALPPEKRAVVIAAVNSIGCFSSIYGSYLWPSADAPNYTKGFVTVSSFIGVGTCLAALLPIIFRYLPKFTTKAERELGLEEENPVY